MNHHRLGITALIFVIIISGFYIHTQLASRNISPPIIPYLPFGGTIPKEITHGDTSKKQVIFTFDGGEGTQSVSKILNVLKKHHVRGTFFLTGKWILRNSDLVKRIISEGHEIFNHSYDHPHFTEISNEQIVSELVNMDLAFESIAGTSTKPYFRPPYGDRDLRILKSAAHAGYRSVMWTVDAGDWMESEGYTEDQVRERIFSHLESGTIILMHVGDTITGSILDDVFTTIENQGYKIVSLTQGM